MPVTNPNIKKQEEKEKDKNGRRKMQKERMWHKKGIEKEKKRWKRGGNFSHLLRIITPTR